MYNIHLIYLHTHTRAHINTHSRTHHADTTHTQTHTHMLFDTRISKHEYNVHI